MPLFERLKARIQQEGPLPLAEVMALCLSDPEHGYYTTRPSIGRAGDFTTAPEISQIFGELIGAFLIQAWEEYGCPHPFHLVELGPGRGTLMVDVLRVARLRPAFLQAMHLHLVEVSPLLRAQQKIALQKAPCSPRWHDTLEEVPPGPLFLIANEFLDALPVQHFIHLGTQWHLRVVELNEDETALRFGIGSPQTPLLLQGHNALLSHVPEGALIEVSPAIYTLIDYLATRLVQEGGVALLIDYGKEKTSFGTTLQALYKGKYSPPLAHPGSSDLTAHVDFEAVTWAALQKGAWAHGPLPQRDFLTRLGLYERAHHLMRGKAEAVQERIRTDIHRLIAPDQMGHLFKVLTLSGPLSQIKPKEKTEPLFPFSRFLQREKIS